MPIDFYVNFMQVFDINVIFEACWQISIIHLEVEVGFRHVFFFVSSESHGLSAGCLIVIQDLQSNT